MDVTFKIGRNTFSLTCDNRAYTLNRHYITKGEESSEFYGYFQNIHTIVEKLIKMQLNKSVATSLDDMTAAIRELNATLTNVLMEGTTEAQRDE
jgi:hypothetical protein